MLSQRLSISPSSSLSSVLSMQVLRVQPVLLANHPGWLKSWPDNKNNIHRCEPTMLKNCYNARWKIINENVVVPSNIADVNQMFPNANFNCALDGTKAIAVLKTALNKKSILHSWALFNVQQDWGNPSVQE